MTNDRAARERETLGRRRRARRMSSRRSARPTLDEGEPIERGVDPPPRTRSDARDGERFPSERLTRAMIRRGFTEADERARRRAGTGDDGMMVTPRVLQEVLREMANSEVLREIRRAANETLKETLRAPETGVRDQSEYGSSMTETGVKMWSVPELVHASAEDVQAFFEDLAGDVDLPSLERWVPHGVRKRKLLETLYAYRVPVHRGIWAVKVNYLAQYKKEGVEACRGAWTEDLLAHAFELLRDELLTSESIAGKETELKYVFGLLHYSIQDDLVDHSKVFGDILRFVHEHGLKKRLQSEALALNVARVMAPTFRALIPHASKSHADSVLLVQKVTWCLYEIMKNGSASTDSGFVTSLSDVIACAASANTDAFVVAPRGEGLDVVAELRKTATERRMPLSQQLCQVIDDVERRVLLLTQATNPQLIAVKVHSLIQLLQKLFDNIGDETSAKRLANTFIQAQDGVEVAYRAMVDTACGWAMNIPDDSASPASVLISSRQRSTRIFLTELATSFKVSNHVIHWIKQYSIDGEEHDRVDRISSLLIELLRGGVIKSKELVGFIIAEGMLDPKNMNASSTLSSAFQKYVSDVLRENNERHDILDGATADLLEQLISGLPTNTTLAANEADLPLKHSFDFSTEEERRLLASFSTVSYANLPSKVSEVKSVLSAASVSLKNLGRVLVHSLMLKPVKVGSLAEIIGELGINYTTDILSYINDEVLAVKNLANADGVFSSAYWNEAAAIDRWRMARSLAELQLCLLHNIPKGKRSVAEGIIQTNIAQLTELEKSVHISHRRLQIWLRLSVITPLIGYVLMSAAVSQKFSHLILDILDSIVGKNVLEESEEDMHAEKEAGDTLTDRLIALFSVVWIGQVPRWLSVAPKIPFREASSMRYALTQSIESKQIAGTVCLRLRRAIGAEQQRNITSRGISSWKLLASGASRERKKSNVDEKAEFWLQGTVRRPGGNLSWMNVNFVPSFEKN